MPFEVFSRRDAVLTKRPQVTVQRSGAISINASAHRLLGEPERIELLFDRDRRAIGLRADHPRGESVNVSSADSFPLRPQGAKGTTFVVSARAFLITYGIPYTSSMRYEASMEDGILTVDLNGGPKDVGRSTGPITAVPPAHEAPSQEASG